MYEPNLIKSIFNFIKWTVAVVVVVTFISCSFYVDHVRFNY